MGLTFSAVSILKEINTQSRYQIFKYMMSDFGIYIETLERAMSEAAIEAEARLHDKYAGTETDDFKTDELYIEYLMTVAASRITTQIYDIYCAHKSGLKLSDDQIN